MIKLISSTTGYLRMLLALFLIIQSPAGAGQLTPGERLEYTFSYQGIFTGYISMKIAHAEFAIQPTVVIINGQKTYLSSLEVSTESFGMVEMLYPIRYRYRSWFPILHLAIMKSGRYQHIWICFRFNLIVG